MLGFAAGAESDDRLMAARYFGMANYGKIYGLLYMAFGIQPWSRRSYGLVRERDGPTRDLILFAALFMFVAGGALLLTLGRYPNAAASGTAQLQAA